MVYVLGESKFGKYHLNILKHFLHICKKKKKTYYSYYRCILAKLLSK